MLKKVFYTMGILSMLFGPLFAKPIKKWAVSYNLNTPVEDFKDYEMVVVDSEYAADKIAALKADGKEVIGYVSIGEINSDRKDTYAKFQGELLGDNPNWSNKDHKASYVDPRNGRWPQYVLDVILPKFYDKGFDGVFLDTIDSPMGLEAGWVAVAGKTKDDFKGITKAFVNLILDIRDKYPQKAIFLNRGLSLFNHWDRQAVFYKGELQGEFERDAGQLANALDYILAENILLVGDNQTRRSQAEIDRDVGMLNTAKNLNPNLVVPSLDYWDVNDEAKVKEIYAEQRGRGFVPYVATFDLQTVISEPK